MRSDSPDARDPEPSIRVVVVSFNTRELTVRCVRALCESAVSTLEVCVVDNASRDGSVEALRNLDPRVEILQLDQNKGFGAANNRGVGNTRAPFLALVNSDAFVTPETLGVLRDYLMANPRVGIVGPQLLNADGSHQPCWFSFPGPCRAWVENLGLRWVVSHLRRWAGVPDPQGDRPVEWVSGACLMARREVWRESRGFDEQFFLYSEETDWQRRVRDLGWEIHGVTRAVATHLGGASGAAASGTREFFLDGVDRYFLAHHGLAGVFCLRVASALGAALRGAGCALVSDWKRARRWASMVHRQCTRRVPRGGRRWSSQVGEGPQI